MEHECPSGLPAWAINLAHKPSAQRDGGVVPYSFFNPHHGMELDMTLFKSSRAEHLSSKGFVLEEVQRTTEVISRPLLDKVYDGIRLLKLISSLLAATGYELGDAKTSLAIAMSLTMSFDYFGQRWDT